MKIPRVLIAGLRGGGGKTLVSLGLAAAWREQGLDVTPFKKGPDYIDAAWLSVAAAKPCRNLDLFLMSTHAVKRSFANAASSNTDSVALIEGNRGLFDGMDSLGTYSTAELAKLLQTPVILTVDCTKATRTVAALVLGCQKLDPQVPIAGVILNRTGGTRHVSVLKKAVEEICGLPVLGTIARLPQDLFPERHLGLIPPVEHDQQGGSLKQVADVARRYLDLEAIRAVAGNAAPLDLSELGSMAPETAKPPMVRIGVFRDAAFQFYYPENIEALVREGAEIIEISPLHDADLPQVDGLYIGGGFPETMAPKLSENKRFLETLRRSIEAGLPVYAECGGAVYLGRKLVIGSKQYPMADALPAVFGFRDKPQGHGYATLETVAENPFFAVGQSLRGHEFHYTYMEPSDAEDLTFAFKVTRGHGFDGKRDGLCHRNVLASYTHVHALGTETWAPALIRAARG
jgi:cobyrinic acid a,c-diamide synthase